MVPEMFGDETGSFRDVIVGWVRSYDLAMLGNELRVHEFNSIRKNVNHTV